MKKIILTSLLIISFYSKAQFHQCGFDSYYNNLRTNNPNILDSMVIDGQRFDNFKTANPSTEQIIYIPIVFHAICETNNSSEYVSDAQIKDALAALNKHYNPGAVPLTTNTNIRFCLAKRDPSGTTSTGINRASNWKSDYDIDNTNDKNQLRSFYHWDASRYLNVYITDISPSSNALGVATFPFIPFTSFINNANVFEDCVILDYTNFTTTDEDVKGKVLAHEAGHWLGLYHVFQTQPVSSTNYEPICTNTDCHMQGDLICDTPPFNGPTYSVPNYPSTGLATRPDCNGNTVSAKNIMDYNNQTMMTFFTVEQVQKMRYVLSQFRSYFYYLSTNNPSILPIECSSGLSPGSSGLVCNSSAPPDEGFYLNGEYASNVNICTGTPVTINGNHNGTCIKSPLMNVSVPCEDDPGCSWLDQLTNNCDCQDVSHQFRVEIFYNCDGSFNCQNRIEQWNSFGSTSISFQQFIDVGSMCNFQFLPGRRYVVKVGGYYNGVWRDGAKNITILSDDATIVDLSGSYINPIPSANVIGDLKVKDNLYIVNATLLNSTNLAAGSSIKISNTSKISNGPTTHLFIQNSSCSSATFRMGNTNTIPEGKHSTAYSVISYKNEPGKLNVNNLMKKAQENIQITPNPNNGNFTIISDESEGVLKSIEIQNALGVTIQTIVDSRLPIEVYIQEQASGLYFVKLNYGDKILIKKIIKQ